MVRPGYCLFHLGNTELPASERQKSWTREQKLWSHVDEHLEDCRWPCVCPHPLCDMVFENATSLEFHFVDDHRFSRRPPKIPANSRHKRPQDKETPLDNLAESPRPRRKRQSPSGSSALEWIPSQSLDGTPTAPCKSLLYRHPKQLKKTPLTIQPLVISLDEDLPDDPVVQSVAKFDVLSPLSHMCSDNPSDLKSDLFPFKCTTPRDTIRSLEPEDGDNDSDFGALFHQYLRSPSSSPAPTDDAASEFSGATLIDGEHNQSRSYTAPQKGLKVAARKYEAALGEGEPCRATNIPRIRLCLTEPKITLRIKLSKKGDREEKETRSKGRKRELKGA